MKMAGVFPVLKVDGSVFTEDDYLECVKEDRVFVNQLMNDMSLKRYHPAYDSNNARVQPPLFKSVSLTPPLLGILLRSITRLMEAGTRVRRLDNTQDGP